MELAAAAARAGWAPIAGQVLGKFTLLESIGEGGMARLYLARTAGLGGFEKRVVVKQILPRLAQDAEFIARFVQEARLAATLEHPNIAAVYEVDIEDGLYFYSMEYVRGRDLRRVLARAVERGRPLQVREIVAVVSALCAGLHHAHSKRDAHGRSLGVVHRDVSPSNVLIGFEGAVKLTDFGVAKARMGMVSTEAGTLRGKISYMSPEQCRGEAIDRRSDVYAVGVLLWELLTGARLHRADTEISMLRQIADVDAPSPRTLRTDCPEALERIVVRALCRSPARRYQSAGGLQQDLEEFARRSRLGASASAVGRLMDELFAGESSAPRAEANRECNTGGDGPATGTMAPMAESHAGAPTLTTGAWDAQTRARITQKVIARGKAGEPSSPHSRSGRARRSWSGVVVGVAFGVLLGGGGLYLASDDPAAAESTQSIAAQPEPEPEPEPEPQREAGPKQEPEAKPVPARAGIETATLAETGLGGAQQAVASEPGEPAGSDKKTSGRKKTSRRHRRKPRRHAPPSKLNLDSAMPPGHDGG